MMESNEQRGRIIGAGALIVLGAILLVSNLFNVNLTAWAWIAGLGVSAAAFGWVYLQGREPWAIIVSYVTGAIAVLILLAAVLSVSGNLIPVYVLLAIAAPFVYGWWLDRAQWGLLIPVYVMVAIVPILLLSEGSGDLIAPYVMGVIGAPFLVGFLYTRLWYLLIPAGVMFLIGAFLLLGATDFSARIVSILIAAGLIGGGALLLLRGGRSAGKPKNE